MSSLDERGAVGCTSVRRQAEARIRGDEAVLFGRLRGIASPNILPLLICGSRYVQILKCSKRRSFFDFVFSDSVGTSL